MDVLLLVAARGQGHSHDTPLITSCCRVWLLLDIEASGCNCLGLFYVLVFLSLLICILLI